ncbi:zinc finger SWIM domain-containing protein, partial [mine drainage metagenome]
MVRKGRYGSGGNSTSSEWGTYPTPSVPIRTKKGIALADRTGGIGKTWWSKRWIEVLESFGWGSRLQRGRSYARHGQVLELSVTPGKVTARVQGSRP